MRCHHLNKCSEHYRICSMCSLTLHTRLGQLITFYSNTVNQKFSFEIGLLLYTLLLTPIWCYSAHSLHMVHGASVSHNIFGIVIAALWLKKIETYIPNDFSL